MRARIHRGAAEIGGTCVELEAGDGSRLLLDFGRPLTAGWDEDVPLPNIAGLMAPDPSLLGVVISHPHLDHFGLVADLPEHVPIFVGEQAANVIEAAHFFSPTTPTLRPAGQLAHRRRLHLGPFTIEPRLNDHSAFDAYSMLVEADGRRLFYSGDIRGHGRKARLFEELVSDPPTDVDVLLMEGTHVAAADDTERPGHSCSSEAEVEDRLVGLCQSTAGLVVVCGAAQNLDRIVSVHRAALRSERSTVLDLYSATVAAAAAPSIPQPGHRGLRVYVPNRQRILVKQAREFRRVSDLAGVRVFPEELAAAPGRFLLHVPVSAVAELLRTGVLDQHGAVVWSLWDGYLAEPSGARLAASLADAGVPMTSIHTSGHATVVDLGRLVAAFEGAAVVPIHSAAPAAFTTYFPRVREHADGEWWTV